MLKKGNSGEIITGYEGFIYGDQAVSEKRVQLMFWPDFKFEPGNLFFGLDYPDWDMWNKYVIYASATKKMVELLPNAIETKDQKEIDFVYENLNGLGNKTVDHWDYDPDYRDLVIALFPEAKLTKSMSGVEMHYATYVKDSDVGAYLKRFHPGYDSYTEVRQPPGDTPELEAFFKYRDTKFSKLPKPAQRILRKYLKDDENVEIAVSKSIENAAKNDVTDESAENFYYNRGVRNFLWMPVIDEMIDLAKQTKKTIHIIMGNDHVEIIQKLIQEKYGKKVNVTTSHCRKK